MGFVFYGYRGDKLDPEIRDLVLFFNREGYHTMGSCAGHGKYGAGVGKNHEHEKKWMTWVEQKFGGKK